jgi:hypothetical protein
MPPGFPRSPKILNGTLVADQLPDLPAMVKLIRLPSAHTAMVTT